MAARAGVNDAKASAASGLIHDAANVQTVKRDETVNALVVAKQRLDTAQVTKLFLTDCADKHDVADGFHVGLVQRAQNAEQRRQAAPIVIDTRRFIAVALDLDLDIRAFRKHRIQVGRHHQHRAVAAALAHGDHIAFGINARVLQAQGLEPLLVFLRAYCLLERRRRNLGQLDLVLERALVVGLQEIHRLFDTRMRRQFGKRGFGGRIDGRQCRLGPGSADRQRKCGDSKKAS